jgi:hypothetical protein
MKYIMMTTIVFAQCNTYSSEITSSKKNHLTDEQQAFLTERSKKNFQDYNDTVSEVALTISDERQREEFLKRAYSKETNTHLHEDNQQTQEAYIAVWQITGEKLSAKQRSPQKGHPSSPRNISNKHNRRISSTSTNTLLPAKRKLEY